MLDTEAHGEGRQLWTFGRGDDIDAAGFDCDKPERQKKLAALFREHEPERPVIVLDRERLPATARSAFDRALEGPIKGAVSSARKQLKQSRSEIPEATCSVLFILNNGYTALNHDDISRMVAHRVRNDTDEIDGVVVGGCYFYSDTMDSFFLWPLDYIPIKLDRPFVCFDRLKAAWKGYAEDCMSDLIVNPPGPDAVKGPVVDAEFDVDGIRFVKPAPPIGQKSDFFANGRPRKDSSGLAQCPPVALTFPDMSRGEWTLLRETLTDAHELFDTYEEWRAKRLVAAGTGAVLKPFVPMSVSREGWEKWGFEQQKSPRTMASLRRYANELFNAQVRKIFGAARQCTPQSILPERYMLVVTEEIGQDKANDVSHIAMMREQLDGQTAIRPVLENARIFHEHALMLGCAYAVAEGIESVLWQKDQTYGWV